MVERGSLDGDEFFQVFRYLLIGTGRLAPGYLPFDWIAQCTYLLIGLFADPVCPGSELLIKRQCRIDGGGRLESWGGLVTGSNVGVGPVARVGKATTSLVQAARTRMDGTNASMKTDLFIGFLLTVCAARRWNWQAQ